MTAPTRPPLPHSRHPFQRAPLPHPSVRGPSHAPLPGLRARRARTTSIPERHRSPLAAPLPGVSSTLPSPPVTTPHPRLVFCRPRGRRGVQGLSPGGTLGCAALEPGGNAGATFRPPGRERQVYGRQKGMAKLRRTGHSAGCSPHREGCEPPRGSRARAGLATGGRPPSRLRATRHGGKREVLLKGDGIKPAGGSSRPRSRGARHSSRPLCSRRGQGTAGPSPLPLADSSRRAGCPPATGQHRPDGGGWQGRRARGS